MYCFSVSGVSGLRYNTGQPCPVFFDHLLPGKTVGHGFYLFSVRSGGTKQGNFQPVEQFAYSSDDIKDPFTTWKSEVVPVGVHKTGDLMPDAQRPREELESYPLDTLRMVGILELKGERWGLVKASDGIVYRVKSGNYMGQNFGKITTIDDERIALTEIVPNGLGGWERREASLTMNTE